MLILWYSREEYFQMIETQGFDRFYFWFEHKQRMRDHHLPEQRQVPAFFRFFA